MKCKITENAAAPKLPPGLESATGLGNPCKTNTNNKHRTGCDTQLVFNLSVKSAFFSPALRIFNGTVMCQRKVSSKGGINIPPHTDGKRSNRKALTCLKTTLLDNH